MQEQSGAETTADASAQAAAAAAVPIPTQAAPAQPTAARAAPANSPVPSTFTDMRLRVGDHIPVEFSRAVVGGRATVKVLGWLEGSALLVMMPENAAGRVLMQEGERVLMRAFTGKSAFAFRTDVLKVHHLPFSYLHLSFPRKVERVDVRNSFRYRVNLPITVTVGTSPARPATLLNVGTSGALIEVIESLADSPGNVKLAASVELHGTPVHLEVEARICTSKNASAPGETPRHQHGVEFVNLQPNDRLVLGSLLWYHMHEHPENAV